MEGAHAAVHEEQPDEQRSAAIYEDFVILPDNGRGERGVSFADGGGDRGPWCNETGAVPKQRIRFEDSTLQEETDKDRIVDLTRQLAAMHVKLASERSKVAIITRELADNEARFAKDRARLAVLERERNNNEESDVYLKLHKSEETNVKLVMALNNKREKILEQSIMIKRLQAALTAYKVDEEEKQEENAPRGGPFDP